MTIGDGAGDALLAFVLESSTEAICTLDRRGAVTSWNRGAARITGRSAEEMKGQTLDVLLPERSRAAARQLIAAALGGEPVEQRTVELRHPDGFDVPVAVSMRAFGDADVPGALALAVVARDLSEEQLAQQALAVVQERLEELQALGHIGLWAWDRSTDAVEWSAELYRITGLEPRRFGGTLRAHLAVVEAARRDEVEQAMHEAVEQLQPLRLEYGIVRPDGSVRHVTVRGEVSLDADGEASGIRGICQDITERVAADKLKDEFLSVVSHELRTPLTAIRGFARLLDRDDVDDAMRQEMLGRIAHQADQMHGMVERLLDFSRVQSGAVYMDVRELRLREVVDSCIDDIAGELDGRVVDVHVDDDVMVLADREASSRILVNLLANAAKFSDDGSRITVTAEPGDGEVVVRVADEGVGIAPDDLDRIFDRFVQVREAQRPGRRGSGVGLAIVRRYAELQGGRVGVRSEVGEGSEFWFTLPRAGSGGGGDGSGGRRKGVR